jgi:hypothetical protein
MDRMRLHLPILSIFPGIGLTFTNRVLRPGNGRVSPLPFVFIPRANHLSAEGAPLGRRTLLSRSIQTDYTQRWCEWSFADGHFNTIPASPILERWNKFGGLKLQANRLAQVDGGIDPWQYACVLQQLQLPCIIFSWTDASTPLMDSRGLIPSSDLITRLRSVLYIQAALLH